ncbi:hemerythrin domain-containing protein [Methanoculleus sp. Wushi-C6]|uniref:Hemerythrin domain-containing protein n=1 Tax=Methanoculleus caldifontis TaxID=2651577 RepID=A0ABU3X3Z1_9EURY|nr:hemerythrin domain-containing protein [Methanoculleus sp. Wushi-C6]MDV2482656.1 hemerythrin domain-containing protein [Methanoculleus sp. Wushi-C6]
MPQILELIREDHELIRGLFDELESSPEARDVRCITLRRELPGHIYAEEVTLYAYLRDTVPEEIRRSLDEHARVRDTLARFERIPLRDADWMPALVNLRREVEEHFATEETDVFVLAERHIDAGVLFELSEIFQEEKEKAARYVTV